MLKAKIDRKEVRTSVIGLGYVGLPLALTIAKRGFPVYGIDIDVKKVEGLRQGRSHVKDVTDSEVTAPVSSGLFTATNNYDVLAESDIAIICVPTPLRKSKDPDVSYILAAVDEIKKRLHSKRQIAHTFLAS